MEEVLSYSEEQLQIRGKVAKPMLWLAMVSMAMIFAALTSAYVVRMEKGDWLQFQLPQLFYVSTAIIILSSVTMNWAVSSAKKNDFKNVKRASLFTLILGLTFVVFQFKAWGFLVANHIVFAGKYSNAAGSFLYALTGLHMAHLAGGIIALMVVLIKSLQQKYFVRKEAI
ncbi:MAG: cytochrome c oxidase subunit 3, partial [Bacteroidia bacterium]